VSDLGAFVPPEPGDVRGPWYHCPPGAGRHTLDNPWTAYYHTDKGWVDVRAPTADRAIARARTAASRYAPNPAAPPQ
jgi:hypothetical protein